MTTTLPVTKREAHGPSAKALRRLGKLPGVVYGAHQEATPIAFDERTFGKALAAAGESTIVSLEGVGSEPIATLIHDLDLDPLTHQPRHVDFYAVTKGEKVEVAVPLEFVGESPAVKLGANLVKVLHEVDIEAEPANLPHEIEVDISGLAQVGDQIHASDLVLPAGVSLTTDPEEVIALIQEVEEEAVEEAPVDLAAIEVEAKGKEESPEGGEAAPEGE